MNKKIYQLFSILVSLSLALSALPSSISAVHALPSSENNSGAVLCPPDAYLQAPPDCAPLGPSEYLTDMASRGMELPLRPLQISHPDPALANLPYH